MEEEKRAHVIPRVGGVAYVTANSGEKVLVDDDVYLQIYRNSIMIYSMGYPTFKPKTLHSFVLPNNQPGLVVDHINRDKLDNRRSNLRLASYATNARNKEGWSITGYVGVREVPAGYEGYVEDKKNFDRTRTYSKKFDTAEEAAAWCEAKRREVYPEDYE